MVLQLLDLFEYLKEQQVIIKDLRLDYFVVCTNNNVVLLEFEHVSAPCMLAIPNTKGKQLVHAPEQLKEQPETSAYDNTS